MSTAILNGEYLPLDEVRIPALDRGFIFGDAVYEVIPVYGGGLFRLEAHLQRLENSMAAIRIDNPYSRERWRELLGTLVARNGGGEQSVYLQVTRGVAPRNHAFPAGATPTVFAMSRSAERGHAPKPMRAITREDFRWQRCDIKSTALLANVLLRQEALDAGADEAVLLRGGQLTEGAATNVFVVRGGRAVTPPRSHLILPGITRDVVVELLAGAGLPVAEVPVSEAELRGADEIWLTSSTTEVAPVVELDGQPLGTDRPGPLCEEAWRLFQEGKRRPDG